MTWDAWLFTVIGLALALAPIALTAMCAARFGAYVAWACGIALYGLPLLIGLAVLSLSRSATIGPISDGIVAVFVSAFVLQAAVALALRYVAPVAKRPDA